MIDERSHMSPVNGNLVAAYKECLERAVPDLFDRIAPTACDGGDASRVWKIRAAATSAFLRAAARRLVRRRRALRTQREVRSIYNRRWAARTWSTSRSDQKIAEYKAAHYIVNDKEPFGNWFYVLALAELIRLVKPRRVLEVGSGSGFNSNCLGLMFPEVHFVGLELTPSGVEAARRLRDDAPFIEHVQRQYAAIHPVAARGGITNVSYTLGDAQCLPFEDRTFDLVFSVLAVEQMNPIRDGVFREVARVTRRFSAHIEPFGDFNRSPFRRMHLINKDYFRSPIALLSSCGLRPLVAWDRFPQKLHFTAGMVVAEKVR